MITKRKEKRNSLDNGNQLFVNKDSEETRIMYSNSDDIEVVMGKKQIKSLKTVLIIFYKDTLLCLVVVGGGISRRWVFF